MADKTLLPSQKNEVFRILKPTNVDLSRFSWRTQGGDVVTSKLEHTDGFFFEFKRSGGRYFSIYSPGKIERAESALAEDWPGQLKSVDAWALNLEREFEEPDLWTTIGAEKKLAEGASEGDDNSPFSTDEQQRLVQDINEIKEFLTRTVALNQEQAKFVNDRLRYLTEAAERMGRKDWINLSLSVLMTIIIGLAMPPEASRELLRFAGQVFGWLISGQLFLPV